MSAPVGSRSASSSSTRPWANAQNALARVSSPVTRNNGVAARSSTPAGSWSRGSGRLVINRYRCGWASAKRRYAAASAASGSARASCRAASRTTARSSKPVAMTATSRAALSGRCLYSEGAWMPSRSATRRIVSASVPCSSSSFRATATISRARGVSSATLGLLRAALEGLVHLFEGGQGAPVEGLGQEWHEHATVLLLLDQPDPALAERLDGEAVLAVEETRQHQVAEPAQPPPRGGLANGRAERHGAPALGPHADGDALALGGPATGLDHERVPLRVRTEVGEHLPDPLRAGLDVDLGSKLLGHLAPPRLANVVSLNGKLTTLACQSGGTDYFSVVRSRACQTRTSFSPVDHQITMPRARIVPASVPTTTIRFGVAAGHPATVRAVQPHEVHARHRPGTGHHLHPAPDRRAPQHLRGAGRHLHLCAGAHVAQVDRSCLPVRHSRVSPLPSALTVDSAQTRSSPETAKPAHCGFRSLGTRCSSRGSTAPDRSRRRSAKPSDVGAVPTAVRRSR